MYVPVHGIVASSLSSAAYYLLFWCDFPLKQVHIKPIDICIGLVFTFVD